MKRNHHARAVGAIPPTSDKGPTVAAVARLHSQQADTDELAVIVSMLYGAALRGFCRVLAKALGVQHG